MYGDSEKSWSTRWYSLCFSKTFIGYIEEDTFCCQFVQNSELTLVLFGFLQAIFLNPRELFLWVLNQKEHPCTSLGVDNTLCMDAYFSLYLLYNSRSTALHQLWYL